jgi:hypothetical protein
MFHPMSLFETDKTGHDLTKVVVHGGNGPLKGLPHFFSDIAGGDLPESKLMDPKNQALTAAWRHELEAIYDAYKDVTL